MIYLISQELSEPTVEEIMNHIIFKGYDCLRIIDTDLINNLQIWFCIHKKEFLLKLNNHTIDLNNPYDIFWLKNWKDIYHFLKQKINFIIEDIDVDKEYLIKNLSKEIHGIEFFILNYLTSSNKLLGYPSKKSLNKIHQLIVAKQIGFNIPESFIINSKDKINEIFKRCITKPISSPLMLSTSKGSYINYTTVIPESFKNMLSEKFLVSYLQEKIEKDFEIRTFFLDGKTYSVAIFSQSDSITKVDHRKYDPKHLNRIIPFILPSHINNMVNKLMKNLNLQIGLIDFIKSTDNKYFFLEVNPNGQTGEISMFYNVSEMIANYLIKEYEKRKSKFKN